MAAPGWSYSEADARKLAGALFVVELVLVSSFVLTQTLVPSWGVLGSLLDVGLDLSLPSWFSSMQLFAVGVVLLLTARSVEPGSHLRPSSFVAASLVFLFLSADEGAGIHERVTDVVAERDATFLLFRGGHGGWVALYAVAVLIGAVVARHWFARLWTEHRREASIAITGVGLYLAGAAGLEVVGYQTESGTKGTLDTIRIAAEELMEMSGVTLLLYAALLLALVVSSPSSRTVPTDRGSSLEQD